MSDITPTLNPEQPLVETQRANTYAPFDVFEANHQTRLPYAVTRYVLQNQSGLNQAYPLLLGLDSTIVADYNGDEPLDAEMQVDSYYRAHTLETIRRAAAVTEIITKIGVDQFINCLADDTQTNRRLRLWHQVDATASDLFAWHKNL